MSFVVVLKFLVAGLDTFKFSFALSHNVLYVVLKTAL